MLARVTPGLVQIQDVIFTVEVRCIWFLQNRLDARLPFACRPISADLAATAKDRFGSFASISECPSHVRLGAISEMPGRSFLSTIAQILRLVRCYAAASSRYALARPTPMALAISVAPFPSPLSCRT